MTEPVLVLYFDSCDHAAVVREDTQLEFSESGTAYVVRHGSIRIALAHALDYAAEGETHFDTEVDWDWYEVHDEHQDDYEGGDMTFSCPHCGHSGQWPDLMTLKALWDGDPSVFVYGLSEEERLSVLSSDDDDPEDEVEADEVSAEAELDALLRAWNSVESS